MNIRDAPRLKQLREANDLTLAQLADYLDVSEETLTELEDGTKPLTATLIDDICSLFGCTGVYLLGEDDNYSQDFFSIKELKEKIGEE